MDLATNNKSNLDYELTMAERFATQKEQDLNNMKKKVLGPKYLKYIVRLYSTAYFNEN
jgi:hypothetical protein